MAKLKPCPVCGSQAFLIKETVDGFDMGYAVGCPRYHVGDGIHGIESIDEHYLHGYSAHNFFNKKGATKWWNEQVCKEES